MIECIFSTKRDELYADTTKLSMKYNIKHSDIRKRVIKHKSEFEYFGKITPKVVNQNDHHRCEKGFILNEGQLLHLACLFRNTRRFVEFKENLVKDLSLMKAHMFESSAKKRTRYMDEIDFFTQDIHTHPILGTVSDALAELLIAPKLLNLFIKAFTPMKQMKIPLANPNEIPADQMIAIADLAATNPIKAFSLMRKAQGYECIDLCFANYRDILGYN